MSKLFIGKWAMASDCVQQFDICEMLSRDHSQIRAGLAQAGFVSGPISDAAGWLAHFCSLHFERFGTKQVVKSAHGESTGGRIRRLKRVTASETQDLHRPVANFFKRMASRQTGSDESS